MISVTLQERLRRMLERTSEWSYTILVALFFYDISKLRIVVQSNRLAASAMRYRRAECVVPLVELRLWRRNQL